MEYGPIPKSRYNEVLDHLRHNFFPDEPLNNSLRLCRPGEPHNELDGHSIATLKDEMSIMCIDTSTGKIAGLALNGILHKGDTEKAQEKLKKVPDEGFRKIFGLLHDVNQKVDLFTMHSVEEIFEFRIVSVDRKYRGAGIAKQLMVRSELIAEEYGFKIFKVDATSYYSQKACEALGMITVQEVNYKDFKDEKGRPMFPTKPPHDSFKIMIKVLSPPSNSG